MSEEETVRTRDWAHFDILGFIEGMPLEQAALIYEMWQHAAYRTFTEMAYVQQVQRELRQGRARKGA